ncbi:MAG: hypothetical protein HQL47_09260, partial [Gammaproteobacteria bacterium]|nr:hypothetical protein [Gammaproteobacteria bacterium]
GAGLGYGLGTEPAYSAHGREEGGSRAGFLDLLTGQARAQQEPAAAAEGQQAADPEPEPNQVPAQKPDQEPADQIEPLRRAFDPDELPLITPAEDDLEPEVLPQFHPSADSAEVDDDLIEDSEAEFYQDLELEDERRREPWLAGFAEVEADEHEPVFDLNLAEVAGSSDRPDFLDEVEETIEPLSPADLAGSDLPLQDTEAEDLEPEVDEPEPLEQMAPPPRLSIEPVSPEPILPPLPRDLPHKLVQISLVSRGAFFEGAELLEAVRTLELKPSRMRVFHRVDAASNEIIYSLASMVEPGVFPLEDMSDYATPGITFFMQLPCSIEGPKAFEELLSTCRQMAELLDAELQDQSHNLLSRQAIDFIRSEVQEHARQVALAIKRRAIKR